MRSGLYIHFPFCLKKCLYCDFNSAPSSGITAEEYVAVLLREMEMRRESLPQPVSAPTLYFGGGTPSLMAPGVVGRIIEAAARLFGLEGDAEVTLEANPGTVTQEKLSAYRLAGVNRLSLGVQSFEDRLLSVLGRVHSAREAIFSFEGARRAGFDNISIDLMHSLPGQSQEQWREALREGISLSPEHISCYALSVEEGTPFAGLYEAGELHLPTEEAAARMFEETVELLGDAGYLQYEISNFARPGRASRHNSAYWRRESYLGFGAGAHSFWNPLSPSGGGAGSALLIPPPPERGGEGVGEAATEGGVGSSLKCRSPLSPLGKGGDVGETAAVEAERAAGLSGNAPCRWSNVCDLGEYISTLAAGVIPEEDLHELTAAEALSESFFLGLRLLEGLDLAPLVALYGHEALAPHLAEVARLEASGTILREGSRIRLAPPAVIVANAVFSRFV